MATYDETKRRLADMGLLAFAEEQQGAFESIGEPEHSEFWRAIAEHARGKVPVDEVDLRAVVETVAETPGECGIRCPVNHPARQCPCETNEECRSALLAHFGLGAEPEATP